MEKLKYISIILIIIVCICEAVHNTHLNDPSQNLWDYSNSIWKSDETGYTLTILDDAQGYLTIKGEEKYLIGNIGGFCEYLLEYENKFTVYDDGRFEYETDPDLMSDALSFLISVTGKDSEDMIMTWYNFEYSDGDVSKKIEERNKKRTEGLFEKYGEITFRRVK